MTDSIAATKVLVDTNILIYAADLRAGDKNVKAVELEDFQHGRDIEGVRIINPFVGTS
jgi:predicted nucleic acid-binding protein